MPILLPRNWICKWQQPDRGIGEKQHKYYVSKTFHSLKREIKMKKNILLLSTALLFSTSALADNWYIDGGAGFITFDDGTDTLSPTNIYLRGGYRVNQYFNVGLESSTTVSSDQLSGFPGMDFDVDAVTLYVRGGMPVTESVWLYAQLGRTNTELTAEYLGVQVSEDDNDTMYGLGADVDLGSKNLYLALNYSMYNNNDGVDVTAFNLGLGVRF